MLSVDNFTDLKVKGYTVVPGVVTHDDCDKAIAEYQTWLSQFRDGEWPHSVHSLIQLYGTGHMTPTWSIRLKTKEVFAQLWNTDKLLTSFDAIAIGRPPEDGEEDFHRLGEHWLHLDQTPSRKGLHCYQGSVNLEETDEDDWTFEVMEGSHTEFDRFFEENDRARTRSEANSFYHLLDKEVIALRSKCPIKRIPVPKGGMALWDSRLVHANARPLKGRKNPGRWRFCVFVSMTPAIWASDEDLELKREAYKDCLMTAHWPSQGVRTFGTRIPSYAPQDVNYPTTVPDIARSKEAQMLAGVIPYDYKDGRPNGDGFMPKWSDGKYSKNKLNKKVVVVTAVACGVLIGGAVFFVYRSKK